MGTFEIEGRDFARVDLPHAYWRSVSAGYFATMGIAVVDGRPFSARDAYDSPRVAIIDELARTRYWGTENPMRVALGADQRAIVTLVLHAGPRLAVVGIACGAALAVSLAHAARALLFGVSPFDAVTYVMLGAALLLVTQWRRTFRPVAQRRSIP